MNGGCIIALFNHDRNNCLEQTDTQTDTSPLLYAFCYVLNWVALAHCVSATDIVVYFAKSIGLQLKVCDGQNVTASELFEYVMEEQSYASEARQLFSLWLVSDLLGLSTQFSPALIARPTSLVRHFSCV